MECGVGPPSPEHQRRVSPAVRLRRLETGVSQPRMEALPGLAINGFDLARSGPRIEQTASGHLVSQVGPEKPKAIGIAGSANGQVHVFIGRSSDPAIQTRLM